MRLLLLFLPLLFVACAAPRRVDSAPSTAVVSSHIVKAQASAGKAKTSLKGANEAAAVLQKTASPEQKPAVNLLTAALTDAEGHVDSLTFQLVSATDQVHTLQGSIESLAKAHNRAVDRVIQAETRVRFWRRSTVSLAAVLTALLAYIFRKPLFRLLGFPAL